MGQKVLSIKEFLISHILLVGGLVFISIGILLHDMGLTRLGVVLFIGGTWLGAFGIYVAFGFIFKKLLAK